MRTSSTFSALIPGTLSNSPLVVVIALGLAISYVLYATITSVYRLYFHPLVNFPGPHEACRSKKWLLAQSKTGRAEEGFEKLHQNYGSHAIRIAPNELHISDTSLYKTIYNQTSPYLKHAEFYGAFGTPHTLFVEDNPTSHKARRRMLNPFFSRAGILRVETSMVAKVKGLLERIEGLRKTQSINIYNAFRCVTVDIISEYAFARSMELTEKSDKNFHGGFLVAFDAVADVIWDMAYNTIIRKISMAVPKSIGRMMSPKLAAIHNLADESERSLLAYRSGLKSKSERNPVVFDGLNALEDSLIVAEAVDILAAGSDTTAYSLSVGIWHILQNPTIGEKLVGELLEAIPDIQDFPSLNKLEGIPYLMACVRESIRVANAVAGRLPRIVPDNASLVVDGKRVPPGTIVGMSAYTMHTSEELWGNDARTFNPDRWLGEDQFYQSDPRTGDTSRSCTAGEICF